MSQPCLLVGIIFSLATCQSPIVDEENIECCEYMRVSDPSFAGVYKLNRTEATKPDELCINSCIYTKMGVNSSENGHDEFCFKASDRGYDTKCEVIL